MSIQCPICSSNKKTFLIELCGNMKILGNTFPNADSIIAICSDCGSVYVDMEATQSDFDHYYRSEFSKSISYYSSFGEETTRLYYRHIYDSIKSYINFESEILDVGCGLGDFSNYLMDIGHCHVIGIEPSLSCVQNAQKIGVNCLHDDSFSHDSSLKDRFDMIIFSHVLEHILDFKKALINVKSMLKPDGIIYIEVPNASKYCDVSFPPYFFFTYEHILHFSQKTLEDISKSFGMKLIHSDSYLKCNSYHVLYGLFQNGAETSAISYSDETKNAIEKYIYFCRGKLNSIIHTFEQSQEELILWGIGASTAQLLSEAFTKCNIMALVDTNTSRQGVKFHLNGKTLPIVHPDVVADTLATIVILPVMYKDSIIAQINALGYKNRIVPLASYSY